MINRFHIKPYFQYSNYRVGYYISTKWGALLLLFAIELNGVVAQQFDLELVEDINTTEVINTNSSDRIVINNIMYFSANDGLHGYELWRSDGSANGTYMVKDIYEGLHDSSPTKFANLNGILYFEADHPDYGEELWRSDGTSSGTMLVKDIYPGTSDSYLDEITVFGNKLLFKARDINTGQELWSSDGTLAGTSLLKDINVGSGSSTPKYFTAMNGTLYFRADDGIHGQELWKSNGSNNGTKLVKDIHTGPIGSDPDHLAESNGVLFFVADDGTFGRELWKSNGSSNNTSLFVDFNTSPFGSSNIRDLIDVNGQLFFQIRKLSGTEELYVSDGTTGGTTLVKQFTTTSTQYIYTMDNFTSSNSLLYFTIDDDIHGHELWKSDGTNSGTEIVKDINPGSGRSFPRNLTDENGTLFFTAHHPTFGRELWKSDGTNSGTVLVKDIEPGAPESNPYNLYPFLSNLFFMTRGQLWSSSGSAVGTNMLKNLNATNKSSNPTHLFEFNDEIIFTAVSKSHGRELFKSDGTAVGTQLVRDIDNGIASSDPESFMQLNHEVLFSAESHVYGRELWKSDGTQSGTVIVKDIHPTGSSSPNNLISHDNIILFSAGDDIHGRELWKSDGTQSGTVIVKDIHPTSSSSPINLISFNNIILFSAHDEIHGHELWQSDGTQTGTQLVKDINSGSSNADPAEFIVVGQHVFFVANGGTAGRELWKTDGTSQGTFQVKDIRAGFLGSLPSNLVHFEDHLYFTADNGVAGRELWRSDGTEQGTYMLADIYLDSIGSNPEELVICNNRIYYSATNSIYGRELWSTNLLTLETEMVADIQLNEEDSAPMHLTAVNEHVFFSAFNDTYGRELWFHNTCSGHTGLAEDIFIYDGGPTEMVSTTNTLFMSAFSEQGRELWKIDHCFHPDYSSLMYIYQHTNGDFWFNNTGWIEGSNGLNCNPCNWYGITCDSQSRVTSIDLSNNNLYNTESFFDVCLQLDHLIHLNLSFNALSGSFSVPQGVLANLERLNLESNEFSGAFIKSLTRMEKLRSINLDSNRFSEKLRPDMLGILHPYLDTFTARANELAGCFPAELQQFCHISLFDLYGNSALQYIGHGDSLCNLITQYCCQENLFLNQDSLSSGIYKAIDTISLRGSTRTGIQAHFGAGTEINLSPVYSEGSTSDILYDSDGCHEYTPYFNQVIVPSMANTTLFGRSMHMDDNWLAVGANGMVLLFELIDEQWVERQVISEPAADSDFGCDISISNNVLIIGARDYDQLIPSISNAGAAYIYNFSSSLDRWTYKTRLTSPTPQSQARFGTSVAVIDGSTDGAAVGDYYGQVHIYNTSGTFNNWSFSNTLQKTGFFGRSQIVINSSGNLYVAAPRATVGGHANQGIIHFFRGTNEFEITAYDGQSNDFFGSHFDVHGNILWAGSPNYSSTSTNHVGKLYQFNYSTLINEYLPADTTVANQNFGKNCSIGVQKVISSNNGARVYSVPGTSRILLPENGKTTTSNHWVAVEDPGQNRVYLYKIQ